MLLRIRVRWSGGLAGPRVVTVRLREGPVMTVKGRWGQVERGVGGRGEKGVEFVFVIEMGGRRMVIDDEGLERGTALRRGEGGEELSFRALWRDEETGMTSGEDQAVSVDKSINRSN